MCYKYQSCHFIFHILNKNKASDLTVGFGRRLLWEMLCKDDKFNLLWEILCKDDKFNGSGKYINIFYCFP